jgi:hypothetical protein
VKRNIARFPQFSRFDLSAEETHALNLSQIATGPLYGSETPTARIPNMAQSWHNCAQQSNAIQSIHVVRVRETSRRPRIERHLAKRLDELESRGTTSLLATTKQSSSSSRDPPTPARAEQKRGIGYRRCHTQK